MFAGIVIQAYHLSDPFGKLIFLGLFALSILSWTVVLQRLRDIRLEEKRGETFMATFLANQFNPLAVKLPQIQETSGFTKIYENMRTRALEILKKNQACLEGSHVPVFLSTADIQYIESHVFGALEQENQNLEKNLFIITTSIRLAPFLGLLGTVWGMLLSFSEMQSQNFSSASSSTLSGISMALATTVVGLLVAIPALLGHSYLKNHISTVRGQLERFTLQMLSCLELQYRKPDTL